MSSGHLTNDYLGGNVLRGDYVRALGGDKKMSLKDIAADEANIQRLATEVAMMVGNQGGLNYETAQILKCNAGSLTPLSLTEFKDVYENHDCLAGVRDAVNMFEAKKKSIETGKEYAMKLLDAHHDAASGGNPPPGWPAALGTGAKAEEQDARNKKVSAYYSVRKLALENETNEKMMKMETEHGISSPKTKDDAIKMCYKKSAHAVIRALEKILEPDSFRHLVDKAESGGISLKVDPAPDVLESFAETINSFKAERTVTWFGRQIEKLDCFLNDGKPRNVQEHWEHFNDCWMKMKKVFGDVDFEHPALMLCKEVNSVPSCSEFAETVNKFRAFDFKCTTMKTVRDFWTELNRSPSTRTWSRKAPAAPPPKQTGKPAERPMVRAARAPEFGKAGRS